MASDEECLWSPVVQEAFQDALAMNPPCGKKSFQKDAKLPVSRNNSVLLPPSATPLKRAFEFRSWVLISTVCFFHFEKL